MSQPDWECIAQLGDVNPLDYGGYWVLRDKTGVYEAEGEMLISPDSDDNGELYEVYRFILDRCTYINGIVSDNKYHPDKPAWFATPESRRPERPQDSTYLRNVAQAAGVTHGKLVRQFCSDDPIQRAFAYQAIGNYHGFDNLDSYPLRLTRSEVEARYSDAKFTVVK